MSRASELQSRHRYCWWWLGVADCLARVTGAVVAPSDEGADGLSDTAGVVGVTVSVGSGAVGAHGTAVLGAGN